MVDHDPVQEALDQVSPDYVGSPLERNEVLKRARVLAKELLRLRDEIARWGLTRMRFVEKRDGSDRRSSL